jgi:ribosomal protein L34E
MSKRPSSVKKHNLGSKEKRGRPMGGQLAAKAVKRG